MGRFDGQTVIVTGASSGMGAALAVGFAAEGAQVALVGRDAERLEATHRTIAEADGAAVVVAADVASDDAPAKILAATSEAFGSELDVLVNCAGVFLTGPIDDSLEQFDRQWAVNVRAPFRLTVAALPQLRERRGNVLLFSSIAGKIGFPGASAYCATKGAIEQFTRALAVEEAPRGVRVNAVAPGNVETPMNAHLMADPAYLKAMLDATPLGRNGAPADVVPLALLLASRDAGWITGESVVVDGGWVAQ
jgi:NAD(P)-dependent dehydrogenase (short-subunit alcohol dehydrogenase family)